MNRRIVTFRREPHTQVFSHISTARRKGEDKTKKMGKNHLSRVGLNGVSLAGGFVDSSLHLIPPVRQLESCNEHEFEYRATSREKKKERKRH